MKKMLLATALALLIYRMCSTDVYCSKQTGSSSAKYHHHFFVSGIGQERRHRCSQNLAAQKMLLKQKQQTFVNGLAGFITLGIYTPLEARVYCSQ